MSGDRLHRPEEAEQGAVTERPDAAAGRMDDERVQPVLDDRVRPERVSPADERRQEALDELPAGHPSSPYEASGRRRDDEPDLRSLELPLPDELDEGSRWSGSGEVGQANPDRPEEATGPAPPEAADKSDTESSDRTDDTDAYLLGRQSSDNPQSSEPFPDEPSPREPDAVTDETAADTPRAPEAEHHDYWTEVPKFQRMWSDHEHTWPEETQPAASVDRSRDPAGSWRSDSNLLLAPDTHARTKDAIAKVHEAETHVTADLDHAVRSSPYGGELVGLDYRRKGEDRLKEKVAEKLKFEPNGSPEEVVQDLHDAIRYTVRFDKESYTSGCTDIGQRLAADGYTMYQVKNQWEDPQYKGINTRWMTSGGQRFEVQFHTAESYHAKQEITHGAYERIRNRLTTRSEVMELKEFQREVSSWIPVPDRTKEALRRQERSLNAT